ncbi:F-box/kelch-repeat protein At3g06240-like [Bidens hawaiensis]|uniref:F-box/kelch-repeat protein At3g06240-like n=1 Tax=Bidens hawaiensis TaxID=980011 RepID=UPI004048EC23
MSKTPAYTIFNLPQEIIFNILSRLPAESLIQFRCVCTSSPPLISHPCFTKLHLTSTVADNNHRILIYSRSIDDTNHFYSLRSPLTFQETRNLQLPYKPHYRGKPRFAGSSKGLICLYDTSYHSSSGTLVLWNPSINKHKILDGAHNVISDHFSLFVFGFGFVSRICEFKVIGIVYDYGVNMNNNKRTRGCCSVNTVVDKNNTVLVYSLSTNSWEKKKGLSAPCYLNYGWFGTTIVNGFVNWLAFKEDKSRVIMAFDLDHERFQVYDLPKDIVPNYHDLGISSFGEDSLSLSLCACYRDHNVNKLDVWVMREYGVVDSWKKVFVISHHLLLRPLVMKSDREVLMLTIHGKLVLFDAIKNETQDLGTRGAPADFHALRYTAILAQLDG